MFWHFILTAIHTDHHTDHTVQVSFLQRVTKSLRVHNGHYIQPIVYRKFNVQEHLTIIRSVESIPTTHEQHILHQERLTSGASSSIDL